MPEVYFQHIAYSQHRSTPSHDSWVRSMGGKWYLAVLPVDPGRGGGVEDGLTIVWTQDLCCLIRRLAIFGEE